MRFLSKYAFTAALAAGLAAAQMDMGSTAPADVTAAASGSNTSLADALASQNKTLSTLNSLLAKQPDLVKALSAAKNITIFAPSNDAFAKFLNSSAGAQAAKDPSAVAALLTYHVVNGSYAAADFIKANKSLFLPTLLTNASYTKVSGGQRVEVMVSSGKDVMVKVISGGLMSSTVTTPNINFTGGNLHIIDSVLSIPANDSATAVAANLTSLAGALTQANLVSKVSGMKDVTIFAPSNMAFQAISNLIPSLSVQNLTDILTYHVIAGSVVYSSDIKNGTTVKTANGNSLTLRVINGSVFVNSAKVIQADVFVDNGAVHVLDNVLNPGNTTAMPSASGGSFPAFAGAKGNSSSQVPFTNGTSPPASSPPKSGGASVSLRTGTTVGAAALLGGAAMLANL